MLAPQRYPCLPTCCCFCLGTPFRSTDPVVPLILICSVHSLNHMEALLHVKHWARHLNKRSDMIILLQGSQCGKEGRAWITVMIGRLKRRGWPKGNSVVNKEMWLSRWTKPRGTGTETNCQKLHKFEYRLLFQAQDQCILALVTTRHNGSWSQCRHL